MEKHLYLLLAIATGTILISTTGVAQSANPLFRHLPPDATQVYHINLPVITAKLSWQDIAGAIPARNSGKDQGYMEILKDPAKAGVDITKDIFITIADRDAADSGVYTTCLMHLTDSAKFASYLRKQQPGIRIITLPGKIRYAGKDKVGAAWDHDLAVFTIAKPGAYTPVHAGQSTLKTPGFVAKAVKRSLSALKGYETSFYSGDPVFTAGFSDDADMHMWAIQGAGLASLMKMLPGGASTSGMVASFKNSKTYTLSTLRFDAGRMTLRSLTIPPGETGGLYTKFNSRPLNTDLLARIPAGNLLGMFNLHFNPEVLGDMLDKYKMRGKLDSALAVKNLTTNDIIHALKGDFLLAAVQAPPAPPKTDSGGTAKPEPRIYFVTGINDLPSFMKLIGAFNLLHTNPAADSTTSGDSASPAAPGMLGKLKTAYTLQDNILVVSAKKETTDGYFSNTGKRNIDFVSDRIRSNPISFYVDLKAVKSFFESLDKGLAEVPQKDKQMTHILSAFEALSITGGGMSDGKIETWFELKMADASQNSLRSLFNLKH